MTALPALALVASGTATAQGAARLQALTLRDSVYARDRRLWVYLPKDYDANRATPYPLIVAFDGADYQDTMPLPLILDTLVASGRAPAFVAMRTGGSATR